MYYFKYLLSLQNDNSRVEGVDSIKDCINSKIDSNEMYQ